MQALLAELIGTFTLTFIGAGAGALAGTNGGGIVAVALAHGFALAVIIYSWGAISGAHVNPAVTFGLMLGGKIKPYEAIAYWVAQFVGASLAAFLLAWILGPDPKSLGETIGSLTEAKDWPRVIVVEAVLTFFLVTAVYGSAVAGKNGNAVGLAIGLVLVMDILMGGALTGASMNPARTFGPALAMQHKWYVVPYFVGPLLGGGVAGLLYNALFLKSDAR